MICWIMIFIWITPSREIVLQCSLPELQALIILDDVDEIEQIDSLLDMDAVGSGSLILLTSRDKDLLRRYSPKAILYDVKPLNRQHAQELFFCHALVLPDQVQGLARHIAREEFFEFGKHKPLRLSCSSDIKELFQLQV